MIKSVISIVLLCIAHSVFAAGDEFSTGPVLLDYGENTRVENGLESAELQHFKVVFDISHSNEAAGVNNKFNSVARFINMHVRAGVPAENIELAMVVHGKASFDLMSNSAFKKKFGRNNDSEELLNQLLGAKVKIFVCGQSAAHLGILPQDLHPGVSMSLSAMTTNALLQQQGYSLNPF